MSYLGGARSYAGACDASTASSHGNRNQSLTPQYPIAQHLELIITAVHFALDLRFRLSTQLPGGLHATKCNLVLVHPRRAGIAESELPRPDLQVGQVK